MRQSDCACMDRYKEVFAMPMVVKNNMQATNTLNTLNKNEKALSKSLKQVSTGMKITSAQDDASGYAISERMRVQIQALGQADGNAQTGNSMLKTAEGAVSSSVDLLKTLKEKVINAANDTNTDEDRLIIQKEINQACDQLDDNANVTYNGKCLVDGSKNGPVTGENGTGTYTSLTNTGLSQDTVSTTPLVDLHDAQGNSLEIHSTDTLTISYVKQGKTSVVTISPIANNDLRTIFTNRGNGYDMTSDIALWGTGSLVGHATSGADVYTSDGKKAMTFRAVEPGVDGQIAGLTFCITDREGHVRNSATAALDHFTETVRAQNPSDDNALTFQVGAHANQSVRVPLTDMRATALGLRGTDGTVLNIASQANANAAINVLDNAIQKALDQQTTIGSIESRLEYTSANLVLSNENTQASESTIRDADMAKSMTDYTKSNVLLQAAQSMLAQANQNSSSVLSLLQ